jgi:hypothetical protein
VLEQWGSTARRVIRCSGANEPSATACLVDEARSVANCLVCGVGFPLCGYRNESGASETASFAARRARVRSPRYRVPERSDVHNGLDTGQTVEDGPDPRRSPGTASCGPWDRQLSNGEAFHRTGKARRRLHAAPAGDCRLSAGLAGAARLIQNAAQ